MPTRIDKLTPAQIARFPEWVDKWVKIGLCTDRADWSAFESACRMCYRHAKLTKPKVFVRVASPIILAYAAPIAAALIEKRGGAVSDAVRGAVSDAVDDAVRGAVDDAVGDAVRGAVGDAVRGAVGGAVRGAVDDAVDDAVRDAVDDAVGDAVGGAVRDAVRGAVGGAVGNAVRGAVSDAVGVAVDDAVRGAVGGAVSDAVGVAVDENWHRYLGGCFWAGGWWGSPSYVSFFRDVCGLELPPDIASRALAYQQTCESACWWWPHKEFCMVSDRPERIHRNERGDLHCESGMAIAWTDGWGLWRIEGIAVDEQIVMRPETQTIQQINAEQNNDIRAIRCERYGWEKYLLDSGAKMIDQRKHPRDETPERLYRDPKGDCRIIVVDPATRKNVVLGVPADVKTCDEAQNWASHGFDAVAMVRT